MASATPLAVYRSLEPTGRRRLVGASLAFACVATGALVARIGGDTLFLERFGAQWLPYLYIASSILVASIAAVIGTLAARVAIRPLAVGSAAVLALLALLLRAAVPVAPGPARIAAGLFADLVVNLPIALFWGLSGALFNPREAKRVLGLVGATGTIGCILGGLWVRPFARAFGPENLLLIVAALLAGYALAVFWLIDAGPAASAPRTAGAGLALRAPSAGGGPQVLAVALLVIASAVAMTLADFQFKAMARAAFEPAELAGFFGHFYAAANTLALLLQLFVVHRVMAAGGLFGGLLVMPVALTLVAPAILATGAFLWVGVARAAFAIFGMTIDSSSVQLASLAIRKQTRPRARAVIDGVYKPAAVALTATAILGLQSAAPPWVLPAAMMVVALAWIGAALFARRAYIAGLLDSIERETLDFSEEMLASTGSFGRDFQASVAERLATASDAELPYLLGLIAEQKGVSYAASVRPLLRRERAEIRRAVLDYLARHGDASDVEAILPMLEDADDDVRAAALDAVATLGGPRAVGALMARLQDSKPRIRAEAAAVLAEVGDLEGILAGSSALKAMLGSDDALLRGVAVGALGRMRRGSIWKVILELMKDGDAAVRRAAIEAARAHPEPEIVDALFAALDDAEAAASAEEVLVGFGPQLVEMSRARAQVSQVPLRLPALLSRAGAAEALPTLLELAEGRRPDLRSESIAAILALCRGRTADPATASRLQALAQVEAMTGQQARYRLALVRALPGAEALEFALHEEMAAHVANVARLASALVPAFDPLPICQTAEHGNAEERAAAAEVVDNVLPSELRKLLVPFLEKEPTPEAGADPMAEVAAILGGEPSTWALSAALFVAARSGRRELAPLVARHCGHESAMVRETALFALRDLGDAPRLHEAAQRLAADPTPAVRDLALSLRAAAATGDPR